MKAVALEVIHGVDLQLANVVRLRNFDCDDNPVLLLETSNHVQSLLDRLASTVAPSGMRFCSSKHMMLLQD